MMSIALLRFPRIRGTPAANATTSIDPPPAFPNMLVRIDRTGDKAVYLAACELAH